MSFDLVIRGGRVVDADGMAEAEVGIRDGLIAEVGTGLAVGAAELDAGGRFVIPGGVDSHVHLDQLSSKGDMTADDFWTGSRSAVFGGTTTVVPFAAQHRGMSIREVVETAMARADEHMTIDYGMHLIVTDLAGNAAADLATVADRGIAAVKIYLTYDRLKLIGESALEVMEAAREARIPVMVHAESDELVTRGRDQQVAAGELGASSHAVSHSPEAEREGVAQAISLGEQTGATVYLAHVSTPEAIDLAITARARGVSVITETCPHYLLLDEATLDQPMEAAAPFLCSPPLRGPGERAGLLDRLAVGEVDLVASDHSPYTMAQKLPKGPETSFTEAANGLPGIELRLSLLYSACVTNGLLDMSDFVRLVATNPAKVCGLFPRKGSLERGADADLVVWDDEPYTVEWAELHDNVGYTPYEGLTLTGRPHTVIAAGEIVVGPEIDHTTPGRGAFVGRRRSVADG